MLHMTCPLHNLSERLTFTVGLMCRGHCRGSECSQQPEAAQNPGPHEAGVCRNPAKHQLSTLENLMLANNYIEAWLLTFGEEVPEKAAANLHLRRSFWAALLSHQAAVRPCHGYS